MKVLVTGATGFIGGNLVKKLIREDYNVKSLVRNGERGDLRNYESLKKAFCRVDIVVNCAAALPHHRLSDKDYWDINVAGVRNVVRACIENKVKKLIHISTVGVYGPTSKKGIDEGSRIKPEDIYTKTKYEGDKIIWQNQKLLPSVIIRPTIAYGPGDMRPVFLRLFRLIKMGIGISVGGGENYLHTVYIDNLTDAIISAIKKEDITGHDFIVGDLECSKMKSITKAIAKVEGKKYINIALPKSIALLIGKVIGMEKTVRFNSENRRYKIDKAKRLLDYKPKVGLESGLQKTYLWYKENKLL